MRIAERIKGLDSDIRYLRYSGRERAKGRTLTELETTRAMLADVVDVVERGPRR